MTCGVIEREDGSALQVDLVEAGPRRFASLKRWVPEDDGSRRPLRGITVRLDEFDRVVVALERAKAAGGGRG